MLVKIFVRERKEEGEEVKTGFFITKVIRLTGSYSNVPFVCFCELLDSVSRSAALL